MPVYELGLQDFAQKQSDWEYPPFVLVPAKEIDVSC